MYIPYFFTTLFIRFYKFYIYQTSQECLIIIYYKIIAYFAITDILKK